MSNDNTPENNELDPTVQAVVNALNDISKFEPSFIKRNLAEQTQVEEGVMDVLAGAGKGAAKTAKVFAKGIKADIQKGEFGKAAKNAAFSPFAVAGGAALGGARGYRAGKLKDAKKTMEEEVEQVEELLDDNSIYVDIYEENGQIVGIDNGVLFDDEELPGIEFVEKYLGPDYIESVINEAVQQTKKTEPKKTKTTAPAPAPRRNAAPAPAGRAPASRAPAPASRAPAPAGRAPAAAPAATTRPAAGGAANTSSTSTTTRRRTRQQETPASRRTEAGTKKQDKPSTTASGVIQRAKDTKLATSELDLDLSDKLKATDQVNTQNIKDAAAKMKPGTVTKPSLLNRLTGGRFGRGATYTPGDASAWDDSLKDFGKKVTDAAAKIKLDRDIASKPWETKGSEPGPTDGGKDVLDQLEKDTAAVGGGAGDQEAPVSQTTGGGAATAPAGGGTRAGGKPLIPIRFQVAGEGEVDRETYKKRRESGDIESQDVTFNVRNKKTGELRQIRAGDPEYAAYKQGYERMARAVKEAMIRMGATLTEEGWTLNGELLESVYTEYAPVEMTSSYYYDSTGRLRIMSESEWTQLGLANVILERAIMEAMDEVGKEDEDVDNDGDSDDSDDYLKNRREKIAAKMKEKINEKFIRRSVPMA